MSSKTTFLVVALIALVGVVAVFLGSPFRSEPPLEEFEAQGRGFESASPPEVVIIEEPVMIEPEPVIVEEFAMEAPPEEFAMEAPLEEFVVTLDDEDADDGYSHVTLFFATNRALIDGTTPDDLTEQFANENAPLVTYGLAEVSIPDTHQQGQLETQNRFVAWILPPNPEKHVILQELVPLTRDDTLMLVNQTLQAENAILMYVHGFNTPMELAARRAGQLTFDVGWNGPSFFFSWPSQGNPAAYTVDANMAQRSERALVEVLGDLGATPAEKIVIIAHSMGTQLLTQSLLRLDQATRDRISTIILAAPDIDVDVFENDILPVFREMEDTKVTLYASSEDTALKMSHTVNGFTRIGDTVNGVRPLEPVTVVDATGAVSDFFGHTYFGDNATIVDDIKVLVRDGLAAAARPTLAGVPEPDGPTFKIVLP